VGGGDLSIPQLVKWGLTSHIPFIPVAIINDFPTRYPVLSGLKIKKKLRRL